MFKFLVLLSLVLICNGQKITFGTCPTVQPKQSFIYAQYLGKWYENQKYPTAFEILTKCISATYVDNRNGTAAVYNKGYGYVINNLIEANGTASFASTPDIGYLLVTFQNSPSPAPYIILNTDYNNYSVVYSCINVGFNIKIEFAWILTRAQYPTTTVVNTARSVLTEKGIGTGYLKSTVHLNCPADA